MDKQSVIKVKTTFPICWITFIVLLILKLIGYFPYSWWLVWLPLLIPVGFVVLIILVSAIIVATERK